MTSRHSRPISPARAAFTLLEMAIVISIIGLISGGIVAARNYITNSKLSTMMAESKFYINAFGQFQQQYQSIPGDMGNATDHWGTNPNCPAAGSTGTCNGDGDGRLLASDAVGAPNNPEVLLAFQHLALSGLISGSYTGATTGAAGTLVTQAGTNLPVSPTFGAAFMFDNPDAALGNVSGSAFYFDGTYFHVLKVAMVSGNLPTGGFLTPTQAYEIDNKFDDSNPGTGWILTPKKSALANCADSDTTTAKYDTSKTTASCNFVLRIQ